MKDFSKVMAGVFLCLIAEALFEELTKHFSLPLAHDAQMHLPKNAFFYGSLILLLLSVMCDWIKTEAVKRYALRNGIGGFSRNPFSNLSATYRLMPTLPQSPLRTRVRLLELASVILMLGFASCMYLSS